jgi:endonuclease YncB( thermonuclease family)
MPTAAVALLTCVVIGISDGDTLTARCAAGNTAVSTKIRLSAIDAPEKRQPFGAAARKSLATLTYGKSVEAACQKTDRYGRRVCSVVSDGTDVGLEQLRAGLAWHYKAYAGEQPVPERIAYAQSERAAQTAGRGLWQDADPVPPWQWRRPTP